MNRYWKASLCCTLCFWGVLAAWALLAAEISFGWYATILMAYYFSGGVIALRTVIAFKREWLRLFPDQITRYEDVRWGNAKDNFLPGPIRQRQGLRQMEKEMLASPDKTPETETIIQAERHVGWIVAFHFAVIIATTLGGLWVSAFLT